ncbi:MAG: SpoIIE family protein phosphatase, partial [Thiotrichaceae bacterium]|nr:SpoIIE family protein phosphatase [Thiotrichaceae bacterium]
DVSGKGVPAALFMSVTKAMVKSRASDDLSPASIMTHANDELSTDNESSMFITFFICILNIKTGEMVYTNAGHNPPHIKRKDGTIETLKKRHGPVLGVVEGFAYQEGKTTLYQDDMVLLYTDGVTEAMDPDENLFNDQRLLDLLTLRHYETVEDLVDTTIKAVEEFENGSLQTDDITVLALKFLNPIEESIIHSLDLTLKNQLTEIDRTNNSFNVFADEHDIPIKIRRTMGVVFDELLNNIISYAYPDKDEHEIEIRIEHCGDDLVITIADDGIPFNPFQKEGPNIKLSIEDREIGGLGIHLVRQLMDKVSYQRKIDKNVVTLVKTISK